MNGSPPSLAPADWWLTPALSQVLPHRLFWLLGADQQGSRGENEWHALLALLRIEAPRSGFRASYGCWLASRLVVREALFLAIVREAAANDPTLRDIQQQLLRIQHGGSGPVDVGALEIRSALRQHTLHYAVLDLLRRMLPR